MIFVAVFVIGLCVDLSLAQINPSYCRISPAHTLCRYEGISPPCGNPVARGLSQAEKNEIVSMHNKLRAQVANGLEKRGSAGPQPSASDMLELVWDDELAAIAQRWADQCTFGHDANRNVDRFKVGQNVFQSSTTQPGPVDWAQSINGWFNEVDIFDRRNVDAFQFSTSTGHYTQMVWGSTRTIGCGSISYNGGRFINKYVVCNYGPTGNFIGSHMYSKGQPCSSCPGSCSTQNPGLCTAITGHSLPKTPIDQPIQPILPAQPVQPLQSIQVIQPAQPITIQQPINTLPQAQQPINLQQPLVIQQPQQPFAVLQQQPGAQPQQALIVQSQNSASAFGPSASSTFFTQQPQRPVQTFMRPVNGMFNRFFTFFG